jgi:subtilase family serine protease
MTARFAAILGALVAVAIASSPAPPLAQSDKRGGPAIYAPADHWDRSPALRDIPRRSPKAGSLREAPRFRRAIGPKSIDPVVQAAPTPQLLAAPSLSFEGIGNLNAVLPPDTNGAVGPNHYVQWVNLSLAVYAKGPAGSTPTLVYGPVSGNTLWAGFGGACETTNNGDPVVRYDQLADRWVMTQLALPNSFFGIYLAPFYECIAVSATPDPTGPYYRYQYSFDKLNDYPKFGVWPDAYYMTMNQFSPPFLSWAGQGVVAFDRARMLAGQPAGMISFDLSTVDLNLGGMLPSDLEGPPPPAGSPNFFMEVDDDAWGVSPVDQLQIWKFHVDWTTPSNSSFTHAASLPTAPFDSNLCGGAENCVPQPGTSVGLDTLSDRLMYRIQYRNFGDHESLVVNHSVDADGTDHAGIRWYELRDPNGTPVIYQQGTYAPDADHRWMGSAAMDNAGNIAVGFSVSGLSTYPSIRYAARRAADPLGTLAQGETTLIAGSGSQTHSSGRWGDYSMLTVDPSDGCTFWYTQQYYATTTAAGWQTRIGAFSLPPCTPPSSTGPHVSVAATTPSAAEAGLVKGQFTVTRTDDTSAPMTVSYVVSGTATAGTDYVPLGSSITIPAGAASATIDVVPLDDPLVEPNESVMLTLSPGHDYTVGSPSSATVSIVSDDLPPDLSVLALTVPAVGGAGAPIVISDTTRNQGTGAAPPSSTGFYLSRDFIVSADDVLLGTRAVGALASNALDSGSTTVSIPAGTAAGSYFVVAAADAGGTVPESQEGNNTKWASIAIGPDLIVSALTNSATGAGGGAATVTDTVTNRGGDNAGPSTIAFYLSANTLLDAADLPLGSRSVPALAAGASSTGTTAVSIPAGTPSGSYYVIGVADSGAAIVESLENNNVRAGTVMRIGSDLAVSSLTAPAVGGAGASIVVTDSTANQGAADATPSSTAFYLSVNAVLDAGDVLLGARAVPALAAGASSTASTTLVVPAGTATGSYYVIANADNGGVVLEASETNNARAAGLVRVGPDLIETATTASATGGAGGTIVVGDTVKNQGGGDAGASTTAFYISTSAVFGPSAVQIGSRAVPPVAAGAVNTSSTPVTLPATLATGNYYVFANADIANSVVESTESNNASFGALVRVGPDLTFSALTAPSSVAVGTSATVNSAVLNQGGGAAPGTTTRFYLSVNLTVDAADVLVGSRTVAPLAAGQSDAGPASIAIPAGTTAGSYYLLAVADDGNAAAETSETNNTRAILIFVTAAKEPAPLAARATSTVAVLPPDRAPAGRR